LCIIDRNKLATSLFLSSKLDAFLESRPRGVAVKPRKGVGATGWREVLFVLSLWAESVGYGRGVAKYLWLLPSCVTSSAKRFLPKFGLAIRNFALQH
jgi:hypothetical protein